MALKRHHKWIIGSFTTMVIAFMITSGIFTYLIFVKTQYNYNTLNQKIDNLQTDTQSKISDLAESISQTNSLLNEQVGNLNQQLSSLKASTNSDFSGIAGDVIKSVVTIKTSAGFQGTGFIVGDNGYVVTNAHVLADSNGALAKSIQVITYDQGTKDAQFLGYNGTLDIALLKIPGSYNAVSFGNSENVEIGQKVIAIGNPLGLQFSVSEGIISAVHRTGTNGLDYYIQTDTALNPGNSGGPLINTQGEVIGINNFKISSGENLGFALESNYIVKAINEVYSKLYNQTLVN